MKKTLLFIIYLTLVQNICNAQWPKVYGHYTYDAIGRVVINSNDHGAIIGGAERLLKNGPLIGYIRKVDINGQEKWKRYFNQATNSTVIVLGLSINEDDEILVSGSLNDQMDGFVMKLNACGDKQWCKIFQYPDQNVSMNNLVLSDNSYIVHSNHNQYSYDRIWLYHLSSEGDLLWQKCIEPDTNYFDATGYNLLLTNDSSVLVTGFDYYIREPGSDLGWYSPLWVKFDLDGNQLWDLTWYGDGFISGDFGHTVQDAAGNYYSAGADGFQEPGMKACFFKFTPDGIPIKLTHVYEQGTASGATSITFYEDSTLFIGGGYAIGSTGYSMVIKTDTLGNVLKTKDVPLYGFPVAYSALTADNKVIALGERAAPGMTHWETCLFKFNQDLEYDSTYTVPHVYDSLCSHAVSPAETIELDCIIVDVEEPVKKAENSSLKVFPVPSASQVTISLPDAYTVEETVNHIKTTTTWYSLRGDKTIEVFDLNGKRQSVYALPNGQTSVNFEVTGWPAGMYLARLMCRGKVWATGKIIVNR